MTVDTSRKWHVKQKMIEQSLHQSVRTEQEKGFQDLLEV